MAKVKNISNGPRGAYLGGALVIANPGETIDADDFAEEWFEKTTAKSGKEAPIDAKD